ncbi:MAG: alpha/beta hydrolase fold domain-containing protein [bacterium]|nr:alpha/beta hydrolase fold domain-containing protein [bacterium]
MKSPFICALAGIVLTLPLLAQEPDRLFQNWDKNSDGKLSKEELPRALQNRFAIVDADKDGFISPKEHADVRSRGAGNNQNRPRNNAPGNDKIEVISDISYADNDNPRQCLDLVLPVKRSSKEPLPVIAFIHGGGWRAGNKTGGTRKVGAFVASGDYIGVSIGYRLTDEASWPAQGHDCKAAIRWIKANAQKYNLDPKRIVVWGTSAGGHLTAYLGTTGNDKSLEGKLGNHLKETSEVAGAIDFFGPANFITMADGESRIDHSKASSPEGRLLGGAPKEVAETAKAASPVTHVDKNDPPFLIAHGTNDQVVPFDQSTELHQRLKDADVQSALITMKDAGHGFSHPKLDEIVSQFLSRVLHGETVEIIDQTIPPR